MPGGCTRQASDHSDDSPPLSPSDSASSLMAAISNTTSSSEPALLNGFKKSIEHVEHPNYDHDYNDIPMPDADVSAENESLKTTGHTEKLAADENSDQKTQHKPRRKFAPEPVETTSRSSKQERDIGATNTVTVKRKFTPEPVETVDKTTKAMDLPKNLEEDKLSRPRRKFAVEPIETTATSSKQKEKKSDALENGARPKRRFAVEPVETTARSSKEKEEDTKPTKPRRKFAVEPVETSTSSSSSRRKGDMIDEDMQLQEIPSRSSSGGRRFTPELVGTAKATFRKKQSIGSAVPKWLRTEAMEDEGSWSAPEAQESKFSAANLAKRARADPRRHSYCVPDLPMIQSDSSEEEDSPPTPGTQSHFNSRDRNLPRYIKHNHVHVNEEELAELKTLREQAVAAYGAQEDHVPFGHYGGDSDEENYAMSVGQLSIQDGADPQLFRRMSHHDLHLIQEDMRRHHDQLERAKQGLQEDTAGISRFSAAALAARHNLNLHHPVDSNHMSKYDTKKNEEEVDEEFAKMRKAASPPMQGNEIKFPFSISPKMTRCDPDQAPRPRRANSEDDEEYDIGTEGMWSAHVSPIKKDAAIGLWGGMCQKDDSIPARPSTPLRSGLQTPAFESTNPLFESRTPGRGSKTPRKGQLWGGTAFMPLTPPRSKNEKGHDGFAAALDQKLQLERQIDEEFPPRVITQIYNYLSLGYPPIARPFDEELSKISRISLLDLRKGDRSQTGTMKGHIGAPEGEGEAEEDDDGRVRGCRRWDALRVYVREWARQSPLFRTEDNMMVNVGTGMWGNNAPVRKGSWGF